jgi:hypothetical protein
MERDNDEKSSYQIGVHYDIDKDGVIIWNTRRVNKDILYVTGKKIIRYQSPNFSY